MSEENSKLKKYKEELRNLMGNVNKRTIKKAKGTTENRTEIIEVLGKISTNLYNPDLVKEKIQELKRQIQEAEAEAERARLARTCAEAEEVLKVLYEAEVSNVPEKAKIKGQTKKAIKKAVEEVSKKAVEEAERARLVNHVLNKNLIVLKHL